MVQLIQLTEFQKTIYGLRNYFLNGPSDDTFPGSPKDPGWNAIESYFQTRLQNLHSDLKIKSNLTPLPENKNWSILLAESEKMLGDLWLQYEHKEQDADKNSETIAISKPRFRESTAEDNFSNLQKRLLPMSGRFKNVQIFVHGSYGDGTALAGISDMDLGMFLPNIVLTSPKHLKDLAHSIRKTMWPALVDIDPEQHHGAFCFSEWDLRHWNETMLPLECIRRAAAIGSEFSIEISLSKGMLAIDPIQAGEACLAHFQTYFSQYHNKKIKTLFDLKYLNQNLLLFPAVFHSSIRGPIYKPDAIHWLKELASAHLFPLLSEAILKAEEIRLTYSATSAPRKRSFIDSLMPTTDISFRKLRTDQRYRSSRLETYDVRPILESIDWMRSKLHQLTHEHDLTSYEKNQ